MPKRVFAKEEMDLLKEVLDSGNLSVLCGGLVTPRFEREFAATMGVKYGVAMNCAMSVLHASVIAAGGGAGTEIICDSVAVFAAVATMYANAIPVFVDVDPVSLMMNPDLLETKITERTRAIIVTHIFGWMAPMDRICAIAKKHNLIVIEDTAQALLAKYKGRYAGAWGDIGSFSFQASKQMGLGDGGMAITNNETLAKKLSLHAGAPTFMSVAYDLHYNYRMPEQTAAIGLAQLRRAPGYAAAVRRIARLYDDAVAGCKWIRPQYAPDCEPSYYYWASMFWGEEHGLKLDDFKRVAAEVGLTANVGYTQLPAYKHPLIAQRLGYGNGCPLDCPIYKGPHNRYPDGLCPVAEKMIPRIIGFKTFVHTPDAESEASAAKLRKVIEILG